MQLKRYFKTIYHWLWLIVLLTVVTTTAAAVYSWVLATPKYQASTTILVNQKQSQVAQSSSMYDSVLANQALVRTYSDIMESKSILTQVITDLHLPYTVTKLQKLISVSSSGQSEVINVAVTSPSMDQSVQIANTLVSIFQTRVTSLMNVQNVQVVDAATIPNHIVPVSPKKSENLALAFVLGMIIGVSVVLIMDYLDDSLKSEEDVREVLDLPILGSVPRLSSRNIVSGKSFKASMPQTQGD